jgi:hypothetical protein
MRFVRRTIAVAAATLLASGAAFAQSSLFLPNNSAGSPLDTPPVITQPPASPRTADTPRRTEPEVTARQQLDTAEREPAADEQKQDADEAAQKDEASPR